MGKIAIVSNSITVLNSLQSKLVLLREDDSVLLFNHSEITKATNSAEVILFHATDISDITLATITQAKKDNNAIIFGTAQR